MRAEPLLGTFVTISVYTTDRRSAHQAITAAFDEVRRVDALMSIHRADSELSRVNARAAIEPVVVSPDLLRVLVKAEEIAQQTEGSFDVTIRPLADLWGFIGKEYRLPTVEELRAVLPRVNHRFIELDKGRRTVRFLAEGVSLDLGGIAKGYAVDCTIERLRQFGLTNAMVKAGGDLRVVGAPPGTDHWTVQLEDPQKQGRRVAIPLRAGALSTSGSYENFFEVDGKRYSHILNPRTGQPVQGIAACTVIAATCMESDALATACFVFGIEKSMATVGRQCPLRFTLMPAAPDRKEPKVIQTPTFPQPLGETESRGVIYSR